MFQKKVTKYAEIPDGYVGQLGEASIATSVGCITVSDAGKKIEPGHFLIGEIDNATKLVKYAKLASGNIQDKYVLGVVLRNSEKNPGMYPATEVPNNAQVMYLISGSVYIKATAEAQSGYYVFLKNVDATLAFDKTVTKNEHVFTGFRVVRGGKANEMILIQSV